LSEAICLKPPLGTTDTLTMARKRKREEHVNHERWLVSYADFITLLFAFFVVMFAVSQVDTKKLGRFSESVQEATKIAVFDRGSGSAAVIGGEAPLANPNAKDAQGARGFGTRQAQAQVASLSTIRIRLTQSLTEAIDQKRISIVETGDGLVVRLRDAAFFDSASADVHAEVTEDLASVARTLGGVDNSVRIEGHTDALPIRNSAYRSNWELSAARAASVLTYLVNTAGIDEARLSVSGYASHRPLASNDNQQGRSQNRRVDIVVLDQIDPENLRPRILAAGPEHADEAVQRDSQTQLVAPNDAQIPAGSTNDAGSPATDH